MPLAGLRAGDDAIVRVQGSVRLDRMSEPEPDLVLLRPRRDFYRSEFATGADMLLVIEVSDSTLRYDREVKVPLYARQSVVARPGRMEVAALPGVSVDLSAVFGFELGLS